MMKRKSGIEDIFAKALDKKHSWANEKYYSLKQYMELARTTNE